MFQGTLRWAASAAAALLLLAGGYFLFLGDKGPELGSVLAKALAKADSLHLKLTRDGKASELWAVKGGKLRWDEGNTYQIARDGRLWQINETAKTKTPRQKPYFLEEGKAGLDVLALLDLNDEDRAFLAEQRPVRNRVARRAASATSSTARCRATVAIDAYVDVATQHLVSLEASRSAATRPTRSRSSPSWPGTKRSMKTSSSSRTA